MVRGSMNLSELQTDREKAASKVLSNEQQITTLQGENVELRADVAAFDRLISRAQVCQDTPSAEKVIRKSTPLPSPSLQKANVSALVREELRATLAPFKQSDLCQRLRGKNPLIEIVETSIAPLISKLVKSGALAVLKERNGSEAAQYRVAHRELIKP